jgi:hypothetical protein
MFSQRLAAITPTGTFDTAAAAATTATATTATAWFNIQPSQQIIVGSAGP